VAAGFAVYVRQALPALQNSAKELPIYYLLEEQKLKSHFRYAEDIFCREEYDTYTDTDSLFTLERYS
jgi:hypothetical protein